jgi:hypothetical protein
LNIRFCAAFALSAPALGTLLQPTQLLLEKEPLPTEMLLLTGTGTEDALRAEPIHPSAAPNLRNWTPLTATQAPLIRKPTDENEKAIHERMPPRKPRKKLTRRT